MVTRFGTDGVRGVANEQLTVETALAIGRAAARTFPSERILVGRDTRRSGPMLEAAVAAGICAEGVDAVLVGVVPTPALAAASARDGAPGIVISASHNPFADNGLKLFAPGGRKLGDAEQAAVEQAIDDVSDSGGLPGPTGSGVGTVDHDESVLDHYLGGIAASLDGRDLDGLRVVVDCAHGANSIGAPQLLRRLRAEVTVLHDEPNGLNINDGSGSTHPEALQRAVVEHAADLGIAFDGDADRVVAVDESGRLVDGDHIIALCAKDLHRRGLLTHDTVVVTVMSNLGFRQAMSAAGIAVVETPVGDRSVLEALADGGYSLGGEQSGHIIFADLATTGDGLLAAVSLCDLVARRGESLGELSTNAMTALPQVLVNVSLTSPMTDVADRLRDEIAAAERDLGDGRVLLRPSGTEPVVRVMVEATTDELAAQIADRLARAVEVAATA